MFNSLIKKFTDDISEMSRKEHLYFWVIPILVMGTLEFFYFSEIPVLVEIIAPKINWEWGILENLQLVLIFGIISLAAFAVFRLDDSILKVGAGLICVFSVFVFLEETDYGAHFTQLVNGKMESYLYKYTGVYNLHNQGNNAKIFKRSVYPVIALLFLIAPFVEPSIRNRYIKYTVPPPRFAIPVVVGVLTGLTARSIVWLNIRKDGGLGVNIGEFTELVMYYIFFLYVAHLIFKKRLPT